MGEPRIEVDVDLPAEAALDVVDQQVAADVDERLRGAGEVEKLVVPRPVQRLAVLPEEHCRALEPEVVQDPLEVGDVQAALVAGPAIFMQTARLVELLDHHYLETEAPQAEDPGQAGPRSPAVPVEAGNAGPDEEQCH